MVDVNIRIHPSATNIAERNLSTDAASNSQKSINDLEHTKKKLAAYLNQESLASADQWNGSMTSSGDILDAAAPKAEATVLNNDHAVNTNWAQAQMKRMLAGDQIDEKYRSHIVPFDANRQILLEKSLENPLIGQIASKEQIDIASKAKTSAATANKGNFFQRIWNWFNDTAEEVADAVDNIQSDFNPELDPPAYIDPKVFMTYIKEMKKLNDKVEELQREVNENMDINKNYAAAKIVELMNAVMNESHDIQKHGQMLNMLRVSQNHHYEDYLRKQFFDLQAKGRKLHNTGSILGWADLSIALTVLAIGVSAFATGGLSLLGGVAMGTLSIAGGSTTITNGVIKYRGNLIEGKMFMQQEGFKDIAEAGKRSTDEATAAVNMTPKIWKAAKQLNDNERNAKRME